MTLRIFCFLHILLFSSLSLQSQDSSDIVNFSSYDFNDYVLSLKDSAISDSLKFELSKILLERLQKDKRTNFDNIVAIVDLHVNTYGKLARADSRSTAFFKFLLALTREDEILYAILRNKYLKYWIEREYTLTFTNDDERSKEIGFEELMVKNTKDLDEKRSKYIYDYLNQCYELGDFYLLDERDADLVESFFVKIVSYPFQYEPNNELKERLYELYYLASTKLVRVRQKNLERLERTFFIGPEKAKLERRRDYYINKLKNN